MADPTRVDMLSVVSEDDFNTLADAYEALQEHLKDREAEITRLEEELAEERNV